MDKRNYRTHPLTEDEILEILESQSDLDYDSDKEEDELQIASSIVNQRLTGEHVYDDHLYDNKDETEDDNIEVIEEIVVLDENDRFSGAVPPENVIETKIQTRLSRKCSTTNEQESITSTSEKHKKPKKRLISANEKKKLFKRMKLSSKDEIQWMKNVSFERSVIHSAKTPKNNITDILRPIQYFLYYITDNLIKFMVEKTNLYVIQNNISNFTPTNEEEMKKFIGILLMMGNLHYPRVRLYWDTKLGIPCISQCMTLNRFFKLRTSWHIVDTLCQPDNNDRVWKIRPLYDTIRARCLELPLEEKLCVDEQMVPFKGNINIKQYMRDKPSSWGIKIYNLCGQSGMLYDFIIYQGSTTEIPTKYDVFGQPAATVMTLCRRIKSRNHYLYFDNYFSSYQLLQWMTKRGIYGGGTIRLNRFSNPPISDFKIMKKKKRGESEEVISKDGILVTQWLDSRSVCMASNYIGKGKEDTCQRWIDGKKKLISRPEIIADYNRNMGGVDKLDFLIKIYRTFIKSRKWPLRMFTHALDISATNSWLQYKNDARELNIPNKNQLDLIHFRQQIAEVLTSSVNTPRSRGRPSIRDDTNDPLSTPRHRRESHPVKDVQLDKFNHWPIVKNQTRCKFPKCPYKTVFCCSKCNIHLCVIRERNCFFKHHNENL